MIHSACHFAGISTKTNLPNLEISKTSVTILSEIKSLRLKTVNIKKNLRLCDSNKTKNIKKSSAKKHQQSFYQQD